MVILQLSCFGCALITVSLVVHPVHHLALDSELLGHLVEGVCVLLLHARETSLLLAVLKVSQPPPPSFACR